MFLLTMIQIGGPDWHPSPEELQKITSEFGAAAVQPYRGVVTSVHRSLDAPLTSKQMTELEHSALQRSHMNGAHKVLCIVYKEGEGAFRVKAEDFGCSEIYYHSIDKSHFKLRGRTHAAAYVTKNAKQELDAPWEAERNTRLMQHLELTLVTSSGKIHYEE